MDDIGSPSKARKFDDKFCPHCKTMVSKSTYYRHFLEFFDEKSRSWRTEAIKSPLSLPLFEEFKFEGEERVAEFERTGEVRHREAMILDTTNEFDFSELPLSDNDQQWHDDGFEFNAELVRPYNVSKKKTVIAIVFSLYAC